MVLVVGGAGYIGSHFCRCLREHGIEHVVLDNLERGHREAVGESRLVVGDIRNAASIGHVLDEHAVDVVVHFAAYIEVGESVAQPAEFWTNNVLGVMNLVEAMRARGLNRLIFSSTAAIFGEPQRIPIDEDHPFTPRSPYGDTKLAVERLLDAYDRAYGFRSVCLRYFNAAGAAPDGTLGEDHQPESHLLPRAILAAMGKVPPLAVFGTDYDTPDGTCIRDYIHILDLAEAHRLAIAHLRADGDSRRYNLGNGTGFSVREVIQAVETVTGMSVPHTDAPRREGDPARLIASSARIRADWGWTPHYPALLTMAEHAWRWHRSHPNGYSS